MKKSKRKKLNWNNHLLKIFSYFSVGVLLLISYQNCGSGMSGGLNFGSTSGDLVVKFSQSSYTSSVNVDFPITATVINGTAPYTIMWTTSGNSNICNSGSAVCLVKYTTTNSYTASVYVTDAKGLAGTANALITITGTGGGAVTLTADGGNPLVATDTDGNATTTLSWNASGYPSTKICVNNTNCNELVTTGGSTGTSPSMNWVKNGMIFYLMNAANNAVLATYTAVVTPYVPGSGGNCTPTTIGYLDTFYIEPSSCNFIMSGWAWDATALQATKVKVVDSSGQVYCNKTVSVERTDLTTAHACIPPNARGNAGFSCTFYSIRPTVYSFPVKLQIFNGSTKTKEYAYQTVIVPSSCISSPGGQQ